MSQVLETYDQHFEAITARFLTLASSDKKIFIYPHVSADGDALGSSLGLALILSSLGIRAQVLSNEPVPLKLAFLPGRHLLQVYRNGDRQTRRILEEQGIGLAIDCAAGDRLGKREGLFMAAPEKIIIDHHISDLPEHDLHLINTQAAATCEIMTFYMRFLEQKFNITLIDEHLAICLMTGLVTDTGRFGFSNTTARTFQAASELMQIALPLAELNERLFDTITESKLRLIGQTALRAEFYHDERMILAELPQDLLSRMTWVDTDLEGLPSLLRNVEGVELAVLLRQMPNGDIRGNVRSGPGMDAQAFAKSFGGGGHLRAAGFTLSGKSLEEARELMIRIAGETLSTINPMEEL